MESSLATSQPPSSTPDIDKECFTLLNQIRANPLCIVPALEAELLEFTGKIKVLKNGTRLQTNEGPSAVQEAIAFLKGCSAKPAFKWGEGLALASKDHVNDTGPRGSTGHTGSDGSSSSQRIERHCSWQNTCGENISYGATTALDVLL